jgi:hypothetical protein
MSIERLRRVLQGQFAVSIDSSPATIQRVQDQIAARLTEFNRKGRTPPPTKTPVGVAALAGVGQIDLRPIDLLRKIGDLTTPSGVNMARLSASWATRRYFWAIAEPRGQRPQLQLSEDARAMDFHQKTLLSDEFGIGLGGLVMERLFNAPNAIDVSAALQNSGQYQNVFQAGSAQPDYLMWSSTPNAPYYVVECKGCQTQRAAAMNQIRRGLEQVPSIVLGTGARRVETMVVASLMQPSRTTVYVVDPPEPPSEDDKQTKEEPTSESIGKNRWRVNNPEEFARISESTKQSKLLTWAGQFTTAARVLSNIRGENYREGAGVDAELSRRRISNVDYDGLSLPLFPELGQPTLRVFAGVQHDVLAMARTAVEDRGHPRRDADIDVGMVEDPTVSVGRDGSCLIVEGL